MDTLTVVALVYYFLFCATVRSAPVSPASDLPPAFTEAAERAKAMVEKILRDLPAVHAATISAEGLTLDLSPQSTNLQMLVSSMGIPPSPVLKPLSDRFTLDMSVSRMSAGARLYQELLEVLSTKQSGLTDLQADLKDLLTHVTKMSVVAQLDLESLDQTQSRDLASRLHGDYEEQVALHVALEQLRSFCHDLVRSLRAIATYRRQAGGAR